jgi:hypothetical protein
MVWVQPETRGSAMVKKKGGVGGIIANSHGVGFNSRPDLPEPEGTGRPICSCHIQALLHGCCENAR